MSVWTIILMVFAIIIAFLLMVPSLSWMRRILGYLLLADIGASTYCIATYAATGTVSGITLAVFAAVGISLALRGLKLVLGYEKLAVDNNTSPRLVAAELLTQASRWVRAVVRSLWHSGQVVAPDPLNVTWVRYEAPITAYFRSGWGECKRVLVPIGTLAV